MKMLLVSISMLMCLSQAAEISNVFCDTETLGGRRCSTHDKIFTYLFRDYNNLESSDTLPTDGLFTRITSEGLVYLSVPQITRLYCPIKIGDFPFDQQTCVFTYASWLFDKKTINVQEKGSSLLDELKENTEWSVVNYTAQMQIVSFDDGTSYDHVIYTLVIERKALYYIMNLYVPTFMLMVLAIFGFFSPDNEEGNREEKVNLALATLLTMAVLLLMITSIMPKSGYEVPLLGKYILIEMGLAVICCVITCIIMQLHMLGMRGIEPPTWLIRITKLERFVKEESESRRQYGVEGQMLARYSHETSSTRLSSPRHLVLRHKVIGSGRSTKDNKNMNKLMKLVADCSNDLRIERLYIQDKVEGKANEHLWKLICSRLDLFFLILFTNVNLIITLICVLAIF